MRPPLHVILASVGTDGDVFPYVGLGIALRRRGHDATLVASENYRALAESSGLAFVPLATAAENDACFGNPDFWHPVKGPLVAARWGAGLMARQYELFAGLARDDERAVSVASPGLVTVRMVQEKFGRPVASVALQPWMIQSSTAPPAMPLGLTLPRRAPRPVKWLYWRGFDLATALLIGKPLNALRARLGLPPVRRLFRWWMSPDRVLAMFPAWYGEPQPDWPPQVRVTGFPMFDGAPGGMTPTGLPGELESFLSAPGGPPVAFTFGTGVRDVPALFRAGADACAALGVRAVFLTKFPRQLPDPLPPHVRHAAFAPFRELFPRCAAVVHHGGVGTVAKALAAGVPQLVLPMAYDQTDNATRVKRLGAGDWLPPRRANAARVADKLRDLLTPAARERSGASAKQFAASDDALDLAADYLEDLARGSRNAPHPDPFPRPAAQPRSGGSM